MPWAVGEEEGMWPRCSQNAHAHYSSPSLGRDSCGRAADCHPALPGSLGGLMAQESFALTVDKLGGLRGQCKRCRILMVISSKQSAVRKPSVTHRRRRGAGSLTRLFGLLCWVYPDLGCTCSELIMGGFYPQAFLCTIEGPEIMPY